MPAPGFRACPIGMRPQGAITRICGVSRFPFPDPNVAAARRYNPAVAFLPRFSPPEFL